MKNKLHDRAIRYRPDIDGLRGIAVLAVVLFHARLGFPGGYVGVDVFFVISGYLITSIIVRKAQESRFSLLDFVIRRIRRIAPAALVMTSCVMITGVIVMPPATLDQLATNAFCQQFFLSNVYSCMISDYFAGPAERMPLLHTWSLSVEEQFYVLLPLGLPWMLRRGKLRTQQILWALTLGSFVACIWVSNRHPVSAFFLLPTRFWELSSGCLLALNMTAVKTPEKSFESREHRGEQHVQPLRWRSELLALVAMGMLVGAFLCFDDKIAFPGYHAALPVVATVLLIRLGTSYQSLTHRMLSSKLLVATGLISYSLYLWHWPIFSFLQSILSDLSLRVRLLAVLASLIVSIASWRWIEQPARNSAWPKPWPIIGLFVASVFTLALATLFIAKSDGLPSRMKPQTLVAIESLKIKHQSLATSIADVQAGAVPRIGSPSVPPSFLLWGDSHALAASEIISQYAQQHRVSGWIVANGGDPPLHGVAKPSASLRSQGGLAKRNKAVFQFIKKNGVKNVFLVAAWQNYGKENFVCQKPKKAMKSPECDPVYFGLQQTIHRLQSDSIKIWVLRQSPTQSFDVGQTYLNQIMFGWPTRFPPSLTREEFSLLRQPLDRLSTQIAQDQTMDDSIHWIDPYMQCFDEKKCSRTTMSGRPLYVDTNHLTSDGVDLFYGPMLGEIMSGLSQSSP